MIYLKEIHTYRIKESNIGPLLNDQQNGFIQFPDLIETIDCNKGMKLKASTANKTEGYVDYDEDEEQIIIMNQIQEK